MACHNATNACRKTQGSWRATLELCNRSALQRHGPHLSCPIQSRLDAQKSTAYLDPQFLHGLGHEQASYGGDDGPLRASQHDGLPLVNGAVDQDDVDGGPHAVEGLHLKCREHTQIKKTLAQIPTTAWHNSRSARDDL